MNNTKTQKICNTIGQFFGGLIFCIGFAGFLLSVFIAYFAPSLIAYHYDIEHLFLVILVNTFLGWTGIGWIIALIFALVFGVV